MPPAKKAAKTAPKKRSAPQQKFARNVRYVNVAVRLDNGRRLELKPRGERGDTIAVSKDDLADPKFEMNQDVLYEVITQNDAERTLEKQSTNQTVARPHPAMAHMRNAKGEEYTTEPSVRPEEEAQGTHVANVDNRGMITRATVMGTTDRPIQSEQEALEAQDAIARQSNLEGPEAGIGNLKVTKGEVQGS